MNAVINTLGPLEGAVRALAAAKDPAAAKAAADDAQEMLSVVQRGAARSKAIVQALHNYSRGDEEKPRELALARSIDDTLDLLRHRLKNIRVEKQIDPAIRLTGFAGQIDQVFMNLITNAAQAIGGRGDGDADGDAPRWYDPHRGRARTAGRRGRGHDRRRRPGDPARGHPAHLRSVLHDEGRGRRVRPRPRRIVHGIVERHGGRIQVQSRLGEGTTFRVSLPGGGRPGMSRGDDNLARPS